MKNCKVVAQLFFINWPFAYKKNHFANLMDASVAQQEIAIQEASKETISKWGRPLAEQLSAP